MARARSDNVEAGLACVAIGFARGEWVLVEVGGSKFFIFIYLFIFLGLDC